MADSTTVVNGGSSNAVRIDRDAGLQLPAFAADLSAGLTVELWVRLEVAGGTVPLLVLGQGEGAEQVMFGLTATGGLFVEPRGDEPEDRRRLVSERGVARGRWQHVCATIGADGQCGLFVDGELVGERRMRGAAQASDGLRAANWIGGGDDGAVYSAAVAELRVWRGVRSRRAISELRMKRARGDEGGLLIGLHLEELCGGAAVDVSPQRSDAWARGVVEIVAAPDLPLAAVARTGGPRVELAAGLRVEHVPLALFGDPRRAEQVGQVEGSLVRCAVYEVNVALFGERGPTGGEVEFRVDAPVESLRTGAGAGVFALAAGVTHRLKIGGRGRGRLRLAATSLDCPAVRVRVPDAEDVWVVARPAAGSQAAMLTLDADELRAPPAGKRPGLDPRLSDEDAETLTAFVRSAAGALPAALSGREDGSFGLWNKIKKAAKKAVDGAEDAAKDAARTADKALGGLDEAAAKAARGVVRDARTLAKKAAKVAASAGGPAIRGCIASATALAVDLERQAWGVVQLVGEGAGGWFRTVVSGVRDVVDAVEGFIARIGGKLRDFIEFLARLFAWDRFLEKSDELYSAALDQIDGMKDRASAEILKIPGQLAAVMTTPIAPGLADKTLGQAIGIKGAVDLPGYEELHYLVGVIEDAFGEGGPEQGPPPKAGKRLPSRPRDTPGADDGVATRAGAAVLGAPDDLLGLPMSTLLGLPAQVWGECESVVVSAFEWFATGVSAAIDVGRELLTARLKVPWLTELLEATILGGRRLDLLRLVALLGAVPAVLAGKRPRAEGEADAAMVSFDAQVSWAEESERLRWLQLGISLVNSCLIVARAAAEFAAHKAQAATKDPVMAEAKRLASAFTEGWLTLATGVFGVINAGADFAIAAHMRGSARDYAMTKASFSLVGGCWQVYMGFVTMAGDKRGGIEKVDLAVELALGACEISAAIAASVAQKQSDEELSRELAFRLGNWTLRGLYRFCDGLDNSGVPYAYVATVACGVLILGADLADAIWTIVDQC